MKRKMKHMAGMLALMMSICLLAGCAGRADVFSAPDAGNVTGITETQPDGNAADSEAGGLEDGECPEGYVYDYQVSMEPIPEEIAALGGPCVGTIHAFPSRIGMALTELEMEKDPVLKAEVEKRIPEIEAALEEEIGGEFVVDGVILSDDSSWVFFCTEVATGYQFDLYYANYEYFAQKKGLTPSENAISTGDYYREKESILLREELIPIIEEIYPEGDLKVQKQSGIDVVEVFISQYTELEVDKCAEQEKVLMLWETLRTYNDEVYYNVSLTFYPLDYQKIVEEKYNTSIRYDFGKVFNTKVVEYLGENAEIISCFGYIGLISEEDMENLDAMLRQYKEGNYNRETVWKYWMF